MLIPLHGDVGWIPEDEPHPYWRGDINFAAYDFESA